MQRIILSLGMITMVIGAIGYGATNAFFNDTELSTANVFMSGAIDLLVDNDSYYNGVFNEGTSWGSPDPVNLDEDTFLFFDFDDVKPNDYGEDTISLHVETNDAYLCANVTLTSNDDNGCTEPEGLPEGVDVTCGDPGEGEGELAGLINFIWWADDGDNVLETDETVINTGNFDGLGVGNSYALALADSDENIWTGVGGPVPGQETQYIGKAWCFGDIAEAALTPDDYISPAEDNDESGTAGEPEDGGFTCNGADLDNISQTDSLTADISFEAVQARHNDDFQCISGRDTTLTLVKELFSPVDDPTDWTLSASGPVSFSGVSGSGDVTNVVVTPGDYDLSESVYGDYEASLWNCDGGVVDGEGDTVTIAEGEQVTCTVINFIACEDASLQYADEVVSSDQGVRWDGGSINPDRTDSLQVLGAPESDGSEYDSPVVAGSFFSLGFNPDKEVNFDGGKIVIEFLNNFVVDGPGNDLRMWEVTGGSASSPYPIERLKIEVSQTGLPGSWFEVESSVDRDAEADLANSGLAWARYVRLTDVSDRGDFTTRPSADGYDLDAFSALTCADRSYVTNPPVGLTTITIDKVVSGGDAVPGDFSFEIDAAPAVLGSNVVSAGAHVVTEVDGPANYIASFSDGCDVNGNITAIADQNVTCTITNTYDPPVQGPETILGDDFGTGGCGTVITGWEKDTGNSCVNGTVAKDNGSGNDTESPDGGRFALLAGNNGYICREVDATGYENLSLKYYWRGDSDANDDETGSVHYFTTGDCSIPGPLTLLASHELDDGNNNLVEPWSSLQDINLPGALDNSSFFIIFKADSNGGNESFRIDGIDISATPI